MPELRNLLINGAKKAVSTFRKHQAGLYTVKTPAEVELAFQSSSLADVAADLPGASRIGGTGVKFSTPSMAEGLNTIKLLVFAANGVKATTG